MKIVGTSISFISKPNRKNNNICCQGCLSRNAYAARRNAAAAVLVQKHARRWLSRCAYVKLVSAALVIQSCLRADSARLNFAHQKEHRAVSLIQVPRISKLMINYVLHFFVLLSFYIG